MWLKHQLVLIVALIIASSARRVEFDCRTLKPKSLSCKLPSSSQQVVSKNPTIWFKNLNQTKLSEMTTVDFYNYEVSSFIPSRIGQTFPNLTHLMFRRSSVQFAVKRNFHHMRQLRKLNLSYNLIQILSHDVLYELPELESLDLRENQIYDLSSELLVNCPRLKYFNMDFNNVEVIDHGTFRNNHQIEEIYLRSNEILSIEEDFSALARLRIVDLSNNVDLCNFNLDIYRSEPEELKALLRYEFQVKVIEHCSYPML